MRMGGGLRVVRPRGRIYGARRRFASLAVLVAVAALVGLVLLPAGATALGRVPASQALASPTIQTGCFTDDSQSDFEAGTPNGCDLTSDPGSVQLSDATPAVDQ